jgi:hypothetical protein
MTLVISKGITLRKGYIGTDDPDAEAYIAAVEAADEAESPGVGALETATKVAIHSFVKGCKADGIWNAIKASCILAGARTLEGALVPLVGTAPTNVNFVAGDYDRETGLVGNGSTKYLNTNRAGNADPQDNVHFSVYKSSGTTTGAMVGSLTSTAANSTFNFIDYFSGSFRFACRGSTLSSQAESSGAVGFFGANRSLSTAYVRRLLSSSTSVTAASSPASSNNFFVFNRSGANYFDSSRLAFYSIGESLDLALLDARVTDLINAFAAAIP